MFTTFSAPGAVTASGQGTFAFSLDIWLGRGYFIDGSGICTATSAFPRQLTTFHAPGAGMSSGQGTLSLNINWRGTVAGYASEINGVAHAFLRSAGWNFTTYEWPGAGTGSGQGTGTASTIGHTRTTQSRRHNRFREQSSRIVRSPDGNITVIMRPVPALGQCKAPTPTASISRA